MTSDFERLARVASEADQNRDRQLRELQLANQLRQQEYEEAHHGTPVEARWPAKDAELCRAFVTHMRERGFPGSIQLSDRVRTNINGQQWSMRAYNIGYFNHLPSHSDLVTEDWVGVNDLYLCEDALLRFHHPRSHMISEIPGWADGLRAGSYTIETGTWVEGGEVIGDDPRGGYYYSEKRQVTGRVPVYHPVELHTKLTQIARAAGAWQD